MEEELLEAFDAFFSNQAELTKQAENYFINQINENPMFYEILFYGFNNSSEQSHKVLSLILLKYLVKNNFPIIVPNFDNFSQLLVSSIEYTENKIIFRYQAEIICKIASKMDEAWDDFPNYLSLFRNASNLLPLCVFLYNSCLNDTNVYTKYSDLLDELNPELILNGLQYEDNEIQVLSTNHFTRAILKYHDESKLSQYQEHYNLVCQIAEKSINIEFRNFMEFWHYITSIKTKNSKPFFELARNFLQLEELDQSRRLILFQIIIKNFIFINHDELDSVINEYFNCQLSIDYIDYKGKIFTYLSHVNPDQTYELFKNLLLNFLSSDDDSKEFVGIVNLHSLVKTYIKHISSDVSVFIDLSMRIALKSTDHFKYMAKFLTFFLDYHRLSNEDSEKVANVILEVIVNQPNVFFLYQSLKISKKMGPNPIFFDKLVEIFESVQSESFHYYFSILLHVHSTENSMASDKYETFFKFIVSIFGQSCEKVDELAAQLRSLKENEEEEEENQVEAEGGDDDDEVDVKGEISSQLFDFVLIRGCSANLIWLLSFYNPLFLGEFVDQVVEKFVDLLNLDDEFYLCQIDSDEYMVLKDVKDDFSFVFNQTKYVMIDKIRSCYDDISNGQDIDDLCCILYEIDLGDSPGIEIILDNFDNIFHWFDHDIKLSLEEISKNMNEVIIPLSKVIYKIPQIEIHQNFFMYIKKMFRYTIYSNELLMQLTQIIQRIVKPKRISFNQSNEWYLELCKELNSFIFDTIIPSIIENDFYLCFKTLANLMMFFVYTENENGHRFLVESVLPFYEKYHESSEIDLLILFSKMIDNNYSTEEEINIMIQLINNIIERGNIYFDSRSELINLLTKISKLNSEVISQYFQFVLDLFIEIKDDAIISNTKISCSYFLFFTFNKNPDDYQAIFQLIPEILSVFPCKKIINVFYEEIKTFIENSKDSFTKEIFEALISALSRYLSYQNNAFLIFKFNEDSNGELIELFKKIIEFYCNEFKIENVEELIKLILPEQQYAVQYILSLFQ